MVKKISIAIAIVLALGVGVAVVMVESKDDSPRLAVDPSCYGKPLYDHDGTNGHPCYPEPHNRGWRWDPETRYWYMENQRGEAVTDASGRNLGDDPLFSWLSFP